MRYGVFSHQVGCMCDTESVDATYYEMGLVDGQESIGRHVTEKGL